MTNEMSESERAAMRRLFDRFPSRARVDAAEVLAEIRLAVSGERARCAQVAREWVAMSQHDVDKAGEQIAEAILARPVQP